MKSTDNARGAALLLTLATLIGAGCGQAVSGNRGAPAASVPSPAAQAGEAGEPQRSAAEFEAIYRSVKDSARMRFSEADVNFMNGMIHHHSQALEMTKLAPTHGASASIQTLAARITSSQVEEIAIMQKWLRDRGRTPPMVHATGVTMDHGSDHSGMMMPGMLTVAQLQELERARGVEFDRAFLRMMIQHHRGAVTMVYDLFATDGAGQEDVVFKFASDVQADQTSEVTRMERMLAALPRQ